MRPQRLQIRYSLRRGRKMGSEHLSVIRQARRTGEYMLLTTEILKVPFFKALQLPERAITIVIGGSYASAFRLLVSINKHTGRERLIRSNLSARFCFELSGNSN